MKKITLFLSVLLMAMVVKAQSSDPVTTTYDFEDGNAMFVNESRLTPAVEAALGYDGSKALHFTSASNAANVYGFARFDFSSLMKNPKTVTISFQYYNMSGGRAILSIGDAGVRGATGNIANKTYSDKGAIFALGSSRASSADWSFLNGTRTAKTDYCDKWLNVSLTVNVLEKTYSYTIADPATEDVLASQDNIAYYNSDALTCNQIDVFTVTNSVKCVYIDNLQITVEEDTRKYADYTVSYVDENGTTIKDATIYNGLVGGTAALVNADKESFKSTDGTKKYFYKSDDAAGKTIAEDGSTAVSVTFREAETWSYTVNAVDGEGNVLKVLDAGSNFEGETVIVPYNQYIFKGGILYEKSAPTSGDYKNQFNWAFTLSADEMVSNVVYSVSSKTNTVYFSEAESIAGMTATTSGNANVRCSNSTGAYNASETPVQVLTLTPGTYTITAQVWGNSGQTLIISCGSDMLEVATAGYITSGNREFTITANTQVVIPQCGEANKCLDWILIQSAEANSLLAVVDGQDFTAEAGATYAAATYTRTVNPDYNYGTICLPFAPDAETCENYTFYELGQSTANTVTFVEVETPQANVPYLYSAVDGEATTHTFTGGETTVSLALAPASAGTWAISGSFTEVVQSSIAGIEFYAYKPTAESDVLVKATNSVTVKPYRAYFMMMADNGGIAPLTTVRIVVRGAGDLGDGTTAIEEVITPDQIEGAAPAIYNLMGQPVAQPVKGQIYIVNGKKVVY